MSEQRKDKTATYKNLKGMLWDLDNTLYRVNEQLHEAYHIAAARLATQDGVEKSYEVALQKAKDSYINSEFSGKFLITEHNYNVPHLHTRLHDMIDETAIVKNREIADMFRELGLKNALVTHGSQGWAHRVLVHLELIEFFDTDAILSLESFDFQRKNESSAAVDLALEKLGLSADDVMMTEDIAHNLQIPSDMGMFTAFLHHGKPPADLPDYIDETYDNALTLLRDIASCR